MGAGSYSQFITIVLQVISIPIFLHFWTLQEYGIWLVLSTLPAYLTLSDFGVTTAVGSQVTILLERHRTGEARQIFSALLGGLVVISAALLLLGILISATLAIQGALGADILGCAILLLAGVCASQFSGAFEGTLRATGRLPFAMFASANTRLVESLGYFLGLWLTGSYFGVAAFGLLGRIAGTLLIGVVAMRGAGVILRTRPAFRSIPVLRPLLHPALGGFTYSLASALVLQGSTVVAAALLSPAAAATLNTYRTMSRVLVQATAVASHAAWPELSRLYANNDRQGFQGLRRRLGWWTFLGSSLSALAVVLVTPFVLTVWTHGEVAFHLGLSAILAVYAITASAWHTPRVALFAANKQGNLGGWLLAIACIGIGMMSFGCAIGGLDGIAASMMAVEIAMALTCLLVLNRFEKRWN